EVLDTRPLQLQGGSEGPVALADAEVGEDPGTKIPTAGRDPAGEGTRSADRVAGGAVHGEPQAAPAGRVGVVEPVVSGPVVGGVDVPGEETDHHLPIGLDVAVTDLDGHLHPPQRPVPTGGAVGVWSRNIRCHCSSIISAHSWAP